MSILHKGSKLGKFVQTLPNPEQILAIRFKSAKSVYDLAIVLFAADVAGVPQDFPDTPMVIQAKDTVRACISNLEAHSRPDCGSTPKGMVTDYNITPPADTIHAQRREWNDRLGIFYIGDKFMPKMPNLRPVRYSEQLPDIWRV